MRAVLLRPLRKSLGISIVEEDGDWSRIAHTITKDDWNEEASRGRDLVPDFTGEKTGFLRYLYIKVIFLPRQARDKHRENSKKGRFLAASRRSTPTLSWRQENEERFLGPLFM